MRIIRNLRISNIKEKWNVFQLHKPTTTTLQCINLCAIQSNLFSIYDLMFCGKNILHAIMTLRPRRLQFNSNHEIQICICWNR